MSEAYLSRGSGPVDETDDPYDPTDDRETPPPNYDRQYYVREMLRYNTADEIKSALMSKGALFTNMYWINGNYRPSDYSAL
jgi:C1A family cysteine protease